jgi:hypothetical protein
MGMISHEYKCIFIHIPKCAGTSIESALGHMNNHNGRGGQDHRTIRMLQQPFLSPKILLSRDNAVEALRRIRHNSRVAMNPKNKLHVTKEQYDSYYKFTFVRNPWARAYSWYKGVMRDDYHKNYLKIAGPLSFNEFLCRFSGKGHLRTQTYWIKDFRGVIPLDYIGRFENLPEGYHDVCRALRIQIPLPHKHKGSGEDYRKQYDAKSVEIVSRVYKEEIEMFGYSF